MEEVQLVTDRIESQESGDPMGMKIGSPRKPDGPPEYNEDPDQDKPDPSGEGSQEGEGGKSGENPKEEVTKALTNLKKRLFGPNYKDPEAEPGDDKKPEGDDPVKGGEEGGPEGQEGGKDPGEPSKPKVTKRKKEEISPDLVETIADAAARAAVTASGSPKEAKSASKDEPELDLDPPVRRKLEIFERMEKDNPDAYRGIGKKFLKFVDELEKYRSKWEEDHPGEEFDDSADEHEHFYRKSQPSYEEDDYHDARVRINLDKEWEARDRKYRQEVEELKAKEAEREIQPIAQQSASQAVTKMIEGVDENLAKILKEKGVDAVKEEDEFAFEVLDREASKLVVLAGEIERLRSGKFKFDPKNEAHQYLDEFAGQLQTRIKSLPYREQVKDGRLFATQAEMSQMNEAQRARHWTIDYDAIIGGLVEESQKTAQAKLAEQRERLERYMAKRGGSAGKDKKESAEKPSAASPKPKSPSSAGDPVSPPRMKAGDGDPSVKLPNLRNRLWGE